MKKWLFLLAISPAFATDLKTISEGLLGPLGVLTTMLAMAGYVLGFILIVSAIMLYKQHKEQPKLVPLTTPISLFILGLAAGGVSYFTNHHASDQTGTSASQKKTVSAYTIEEVRRAEMQKNAAQQNTTPSSTEQDPQTPANPANTGGGNYWKE